MTDALERLETMRRIPGVWIQIIATSRQGDTLAWTMVLKYRSTVLQFVSPVLHTLLDQVEGALRRDGMIGTTTRKKKLRRP